MAGSRREPTITVGAELASALFAALVSAPTRAWARALTAPA